MGLCIRLLGTDIQYVDKYSLTFQILAKEAGRPECGRTIQGLHIVKEAHEFCRRLIWWLYVLQREKKDNERGGAGAVIIWGGGGASKTTAKSRGLF